jgi:TRIAD3 protein (E3 ubiquitin-protein ligase RNF216)
VRHIERVIKEQKTFYKAYGIIEEELRHYSRNTPFTKVVKARPKRGAEDILIGRGSQIPKELQAAKKKCEQAAIKRRKAEDASREEENNLREAVVAGEMTECQCCFDEFPLNRMMGCGGTTVHFLCRECVKNYIESEMGSSRCRPVCFADPKCGGSFTRRQLQACLTDTTFDRLEHMQQMQELENSGLKLDECPFCDYKQICPPVDEDKEFRCLKSKCGKTSCRLCQKVTHIPLSCEEAKKDDKLTVRHIVEEAMTAALIRNCNKCKRPFIKEYGCNKMSCSHCGNQQW